MGKDDNDGAAIVRESTTAVLATVAGLLVGGPAGAVVAAGVLPPALAAVEKFNRQWQDARLHRGTQVVVDAARHLNMGHEQLLALTRNDPRREQLAGRAIVAGADAMLQEKIGALARVLAEGLTDDAQLDESLLLIDGIRDMEAPHVRLLASLMAYTAVQSNSPAQSPNPSTGELQRLYPQFGRGLAPVLATLERHGFVARWTDYGTTLKLIEESLDSLNPLREGALESAATEERWTVTSFGRKLMEVLTPPANGSQTPGTR